jgi:hypothetical protein
MEFTAINTVGALAEYEVLVAKGHLTFEQQTGLKIDKMTDFILKFVYSENFHNRPVTITILSNTLMTNENTIRTKLKKLTKHKFIEICRCGCDGRTRKILPTKLLNRLMIIDATTKLKTLTEVAPVFMETFGTVFAELYKQFEVEEFDSFTNDEAHSKYNETYLGIKNRYKNTHKKLG